MNFEKDVLQAALLGFACQVEKIQGKMHHVRNLLEGPPNPAPLKMPPMREEKPKRTLSPAARKRIAAAQKLRWSKVRKASKAA